MVEIEQIQEAEPLTSASTPEVEMEEEPSVEVVEPPSQQRLLDAEAIEKLAETIDRPSARAHLHVLIAKLRREGAALKRVEASQAQANAQQQPAVTEEKKPAAVAAKPAPVEPPTPSPTSAATATFTSLERKYIPIDKFSFDMGGYNSQFVTLYIALPGVGSIPRSQIRCNFQNSSFDLVVEDLAGKSYRLFKDNLEHDIDTKTSKCVVKADKVIVKLGKLKKEYGGYDYWSDLSSKKPKLGGSDGKAAKDDPSASIMNLMKDLYDSGDDNMKKMIGETMMKQRRGELDKPDFKTPGFDDFKTPKFDDL